MAWLTGKSGWSCPHPTFSTGTHTLAFGASWLCPNHHYSWNNVYFQLLCLCDSLFGMSSPFPRPQKMSSILKDCVGVCSPPKEDCCFALFPGHFPQCVWQRQYLKSPRGYPTTLGTSLFPGRTHWSCHQRFAQSQLRNTGRANTGRHLRNVWMN